MQRNNLGLAKAFFARWPGLAPPADALLAHVRAGGGEKPLPSGRLRREAADRRAFGLRLLAAGALLYADPNPSTPPKPTTQDGAGAPGRRAAGARARERRRETPSQRPPAQGGRRPPRVRPAPARGRCAAVCRPKPLNPSKTYHTRRRWRPRPTRCWRTCARAAARNPSPAAVCAGRPLTAALSACACSRRVRCCVPSPNP